MHLIRKFPYSNWKCWKSRNRSTPRVQILSKEIQKKNHNSFNDTNCKTRRWSKPDKCVGLCIWGWCSPINSAHTHLRTEIFWQAVSDMNLDIVKVSTCMNNCIKTSHDLGTIQLQLVRRYVEFNQKWIYLFHYYHTISNLVYEKGKLPWSVKVILSLSSLNDTDLTLVMYLGF